MIVDRNVREIERAWTVAWNVVEDDRASIQFRHRHCSEFVQLFEPLVLDVVRSLDELRVAVDDASPDWDEEHVLAARSELRTLQREVTTWRLFARQLETCSANPEDIAIEERKFIRSQFSASILRLDTYGVLAVDRAVPIIAIARAAYRKSLRDDLQLPI